MLIATRLALTLSLASLSGMAIAEDNDSFLDGRLTVDSDPGVYSIAYTSGGKDGSEDLKAKRGLGIGLGVERGQYVSAGWGWVVGVALLGSANRGDGENGHDDIKTSQLGVVFNAGVAYRINRKIHLELTPQFGFGGGKVTDVGSNNGGDTSARGPYIDYGISLAGFYDVTDRWQVGANSGFLGSRAKAAIDYGYTTADVKVKTGGLDAGLSLGYHF